MKTNRKQLLIVYICLALGAWSASAGISFSQSNRDTNQTRRDNTTIQHKSEKTVDDSDQGSPVIASYYKDGKKKKNKSTAADETKLSEKQKATKELNEHSWVEEAGKHPLPYAVVEGKAVSEEELAHWWKVFNDPVLDQLIDLTLKNNRQLEVARSRVRQGRLQLGIAEAQRLPWLDASGSWSANRGQGEWDSDREAIKNLPISDKMTRNVETGKLGLDARWEIDIFGRQKAKSRAASNSLQASQADLYSTWVSLSAETALQYMSLRTLQEQLRITEDDVKRQQEALELIKINNQSGIINELPVQQATYALSQTQAEIPSLKKNIASTMAALSILTGTVPGEIDGLLMENTSLPTVNPHMFIGIPAEALRQRPDIQAAERRIAAQQQKTKAAKADTIMIRGIHTPTPVSAHAPVAGRCPFSIRSTILYNMLMTWAVTVGSESFNKSLPKGSVARKLLSFFCCKFIFGVPFFDCMFCIFHDLFIDLPVKFQVFFRQTVKNLMIKLFLHRRNGFCYVIRF